MFCPNCGRPNIYGRECDCGTLVKVPYETMSGWITTIQFKNKPYNLKEITPDISYFVKEADKRNEQK